MSSGNARPSLPAIDALADVLGQEFHTLFVRLSRNKVMQEIHAQLVRRTTLLRSLDHRRFRLLQPARRPFDV